MAEEAKNQNMYAITGGTTTSPGWQQTEFVGTLRAALIELLIYAEKCDDMLDERCPDMAHHGLEAARKALGLMTYEDTRHGPVVHDQEEDAE